MSSSFNIVLFGQTGSGKSSVINLIAGREMAKTSNGAAGCTLSYKPYAFPVDGRTYRIWDTVGLNEANMELDAIAQAYNLIHELSRNGGVNLLLFCIRAPRITATSQENYRLFYEELCLSQVPIAFVITHLEQEADMERWWERNVKRLEEFGLKAAGHACVTGLPLHSKYRESQLSITRLLDDCHDIRRSLKPPEPNAWFTEFLRSLRRSSLFKKEPTRRDVVWVLTHRCKLDPETAKKIMDMMERTDAV